MPARHLSWLLRMSPLQSPHLQLILDSDTHTFVCCSKKNPVEIPNYLNLIFQFTALLFTQILPNGYLISCKIINICFPLHCCSRYFLSLSKQRWGFAEPTRIIGKRASMHGMWERFRIIGKSFEAASWMNYDLAEKTFISYYLFWEDLLTIISSISRIFGHNYRTTVIPEKWASLSEHSCCAQYIKVQIEPHTIDLLLPDGQPYNGHAVCFSLHPWSSFFPCDAWIWWWVH